jgi:speckle-type POZ protein
MACMCSISWGYSVHKAKGVRQRFLHHTSGTFSVSGHDWNISLLPNAIYSVYDGGAVQHCISVYLALMSKGTKVRASCELGLVDKTMGPPSPVHRTLEPREFRYSDHSMFLLLPADFSLSTATSTSSKKHRVRVHEHICSWAGLRRPPATSRSTSPGCWKRGGRGRHFHRGARRS